MWKIWYWWKSLVSVGFVDELTLEKEKKSNLLSIRLLVDWFISKQYIFSIKAVVVY